MFCNSCVMNSCIPNTSFYYFLCFTFPLFYYYTPILLMHFFSFPLFCVLCCKHDLSVVGSWLHVEKNEWRAVHPFNFSLEWNPNVSRGAQAFHTRWRLIFLLPSDYPMLTMKLPKTEVHRPRILQVDWDCMAKVRKTLGRNIVEGENNATIRRRTIS